MKYAKILILILMVSLVMGLGAFAEEKVVCPVSGKEIKKAEAKTSYEYKGKTYYFCCDNCKDAFVQNPDKYADHKAVGEHKCCGDHEADMVKDPVCGMKFKKDGAKATYEHNGDTYYFCMEECRDKFAKDPEAYLQKGEKATCPVSGKEIEVKKSTPNHDYDGKTYYFCCDACKEKFMKSPEEYVKK